MQHLASSRQCRNAIIQQVIEVSQTQQYIHDILFNIIHLQCIQCNDLQEKLEGLTFFCSKH